MRGDARYGETPPAVHKRPVDKFDPLDRGPWARCVALGVVGGLSSYHPEIGPPMDTLHRQSNGVVRPRVGPLR